MSLRTAMGAALAWAAPAVAWACPMCAGREDGNALAEAAILGTMIAFPFLLLPPIVRRIKAGGKDLPY